MGNVWYNQLIDSVIHKFNIVPTRYQIEIRPMTTIVENRLILPAIISIMGVTATQLWYKNATKAPPSNDSGPTIAVLERKNSQVERRPTTRLLWQAVERGDHLRAGEAVRTGSDASGQIKFLKSGVTVSLEPDSVVVIEESNGQVALNLVNGGLFVKNDENNPQSKSNNASSQPVIKAGSQTLSLGQKKSEVNLSLSDSGQANVLVGKGDVVLDQSGKKQSLEQGSAKTFAATAQAAAPIELLGLSPNSLAAFTSTTGQTLKVQWNPMKGAQSLILELGRTRDTLSKSTVNLSATDRNIGVPLKIGANFWRVKAYDVNQKLIGESAIIYNEAISLEQPRLLQNFSGETIAKATSSSKVKLEWASPPRATLCDLIIAKDSQFKSVALSKSFDPQETTFDFNTANSGPYYWQVKARWTGISQTATSVTGHFTITDSADLPVPMPTAPANGEKFKYTEIKNQGIPLKWTAPLGNHDYLITLEKYDSNAKKWVPINNSATKNQFHKIDVQSSGLWRWKVLSQRDKQQSKPSDWSQFVITNLLTIDLTSWSQKKQIINVDKIVKLPLPKFPTNTKTLRYRFTKAGTPINNDPWKSQPLAPLLPIKITTGPDHLHLELEALDTAGNAIAQGSNQDFEVAPPDLLPAPKLPNQQTFLNASASGDVTFQWTKIEGAAKIQINIELSDDQKTKLKREYLPTQKPTVSGFKPGTHKFTFTAIDASGKPGTKSPVYEIKVPEESDLAAPTAKGLRVK
jgi:hypothetical protein